VADYRALAQALDPYAMDTGGITPDTLKALQTINKSPNLMGMIADIGRGGLSNLESLVRGGVAQVPGTVGDLETLGRMGINTSFGAGGVKVSPKAVMPTTTDILGMMPQRVTQARPETAGMEELGTMIAPGLAKAAAPVVKGGGNLLGMAMNERLLAGQPILPSLAKEPQSAMFAVNPTERGIVREGNPIQSAVVLIGDKIFTGRTHGDALNRAIYEGVVRKEGGKFIYPKGAEIDQDLFMTKDGQIIDRLQASKMLDIGASETAIEKGLMQNNPASSMTVDSYMEQATALKKQKEQSPYPQQAALDLAQQRAALPVEQGGLGLPKDNTPEMRAQAMGFDQSVYRGYQFGTGRNKNTFYTDNPKIASQYAEKSGNAQYEIKSGGDRYLFDTYQEAKSAQKNDVGGRITKLKNEPTVQANLLRMENPLVVDAKEKNWNWITDPFKPVENQKALEEQLANVTKDKVINGRPYTVEEQKQDILRDNYFQVFTDTNR